MSKETAIILRVMMNFFIKWQCGLKKSYSKVLVDGMTPYPKHAILFALSFPPYPPPLVKTKQMALKYYRHFSLHIWGLSIWKGKWRNIYSRTSALSLAQKSWIHWASQNSSRPVVFSQGSMNYRLHISSSFPLWSSWPAWVLDLNPVSAT